MKSVWKFPIQEVTDSFKLDMPIGAKVLSFQTQKNEAERPKGYMHDVFGKKADGVPPVRDVETPTIWAEVDLDFKTETEVREFRLLGTGHEFIADSITNTYIGTTQLYNGALVLHLYEIKR